MSCVCVSACVSVCMWDVVVDILGFGSFFYFTQVHFGFDVAAFLSGWLTGWLAGWLIICKLGMIQYACSGCLR
ncbi:hypothetical protein HOY80DRAFT_985212 [Tuber brumale]|nr:hypothetical protein HOY80DRAFT_985212 [Tuber brumale]